MTDSAPRRKSPSLAAKVLAVSVIGYSALALCMLAVWNVGVPVLGLRGRIAEIVGRDTSYVSSALADRLGQVEAWLSSRKAEAKALSLLESSDPRLGLLAAGGPGAGLDTARRELEARYASVCDGSESVARILVVRKGDRRVLLDSSGALPGDPYSFQFPPEDSSLGQRFDSTDIRSFDDGLTTTGVPIVFVLVAPAGALFRQLSGERLKGPMEVGIAITEADGRLISPLSIPGSGLEFTAGEVPVGGMELERLAGLEQAAAGGDTVDLIQARESLFMAAARVSLPEGRFIYIVAAMARAGAISQMVHDWIAMAVLALFLMTTTSLLMFRYIWIQLSPLSRLRAAVESFGKGGAYDFQDQTPGDVGEIARAFSALTRNAEEWKGELDAEVESRTRMLRLTAEFSGVFARDTSEKAAVAAVNILKEAFNADAAALFYVNAKREYRLCLAGTDFPIALPEKRWLSSIAHLNGNSEVDRFGPWSPPGVDTALPSWISYRVYSMGAEGGYIFMGKKEGDWSVEDETDLVVVARTIAPIVKVRREREQEELVRQEAEGRLAGNERRLRTFLEGARDMIYTVDSADVVTGINTAGVNLLGQTDKASVLGVPFCTFALNPDDRKLLLDRVKEVGYVADYEIILKRDDGGGIFCLETAYAIRDSNGGIIELQGIVKDISERIRNEQALWKTNVELAEANFKIQKTNALMIQHEKLASIGQLAAGVAHELNNPLGFLKSNHEMIEKYILKVRKAWDEALSSSAPDLAGLAARWDLDYLFTEMGKMLDESDEGFARIIHIVSSLKNFSRIEQGTAFTLYDVNAGIESTLVVARNEIKYIAEVEKDLGELPQIHAHGGEINQVLLNIFVNAAQAIEGQKRKGKGIISIRTARSGENVVIEICDDGPGIPESFRAKIFDPFFTTKEPGKGTGLGLSISYDIVVVKHAGHLDVASPPGGGTVFTIELPIAGPAGSGKPDF